MPLGFQIRVLPCGLWRANHASPRGERPFLIPVDTLTPRLLSSLLTLHRLLSAGSFVVYQLCCKSQLNDIFGKPGCRWSFENYATAFDAHRATRAFAVYGTSVLPVVAELGFRVRRFRVSHFQTRKVSNKKLLGILRDPAPLGQPHLRDRAAGGDQAPSLVLRVEGGPWALARRPCSCWPTPEQPRHAAHRRHSGPVARGARQLEPRLSMPGAMCSRTPGDCAAVACALTRCGRPSRPCTPRTVCNSWPLRVDGRGGDDASSSSAAALCVFTALLTHGDCAMGTAGGRARSLFVCML